MTEGEVADIGVFENINKTFFFKDNKQTTSKQIKPTTASRKKPSMGSVVQGRCLQPVADIDVFENINKTFFFKDNKQTYKTNNNIKKENQVWGPSSKGVTDSQ